MVKENWNEMTADEKADHLREALKEMMNYQTAAQARIEARIGVLEEQAAGIERVIASKH